MSDNVHLFGVRHHGPGSARSLARALEALQPDVVLIEGPPDANEIISLAAHAEIKPPVALLVYAADSPRSAVLYPFADYSPEWQAIKFALRSKVAVRFIDLPQAHRLQGERPSSEEAATAAEQLREVASDPLQPLAAAAGYNDAERWWDELVESRSGNDLDVFAAVHEMMKIARDTMSQSTMPQQDSNTATAVAPEPIELQREAFMRTCIREALDEGCQRIAVVCGAYHTPALSDLDCAKADRQLLKNLKKTKISAAWVPWSYERLSFRSGYGAGIESPIWYELLWQRNDSIGARWLTSAARLLRDEDIPVSSAHVIEACRLADSLAALRGRPVAGLPEYNDAALSVMLNGDSVSLQLIDHRWNFGNRLGFIPETFPASPLQQDLTAQQKRLRLPPKAEEKSYDLDLREAMDRERSQLLHRLRLLNVNWGTPVAAGNARKGTFHEVWQVKWEPDFAIPLVVGSTLGHTIEQAASNSILEKCLGAASLKELIALLESGLFADLPTAIPTLITAIENLSATSGDIAQLLDALAPLINVRRYGDVRSTDVSMLDHILNGMVPRICIALPNAATGLDEEAAKQLWERVKSAQQGLTTLGNAVYLADWFATLRRVASSDSIAALLSGYATRVLYDAHEIDRDDLTTRLAFALSVGNDPLKTASWIEGFLAGTGTLLVHDATLRGAFDAWVCGVTAEHFTQALPLLRRTFAQFPYPERRQIGEHLKRARQADSEVAPSIEDLAFDESAAAAMMATLKTIWLRKDAQDCQ